MIAVHSFNMAWLVIAAHFFVVAWSVIAAHSFVVAWFAQIQLTNQALQL